MGSKKQRLPFDKRGGTLVISRALLKSVQYRGMTPHAKCLFILMQEHWRDTKPVDYGVREAMKKIPCSFETARKAFNQLREHGFIIMVDESIFNSRTQSKTRTWRLTWMPYMGKYPTSDWGKINVTDLKMKQKTLHRPKNETVNLKKAAKCF